MTTPHLKSTNSDDCDLVRRHLQPHFQKVEAYRYNSASIRIRIMDQSFQAVPTLERIERVEALLDQLPEELQQDIVFVLCLAEGEESHPQYAAINQEFQHPDLQPETLIIE